MFFFCCGFLFVRLSFSVTEKVLFGFVVRASFGFLSGLCACGCLFLSIFKFYIIVAYVLFCVVVKLMFNCSCCKFVYVRVHVRACMPECMCLFKLFICFLLALCCVRLVSYSHLIFCMFSMFYFTSSINSITRNILYRFR